MPQERRKNDSKVLQRLAVVETISANQAKDIEEILSEVKSVAAFIYGCKPRLEALEQKNLPQRLTRVETRQRIYGCIALVVLGLAATKEYLGRLIFGS